jgi:hypothetical protein
VRSSEKLATLNILDYHKARLNEAYQISQSRVESLTDSRDQLAILRQFIKASTEQTAMGLSPITSAVFLKI